jgi:hypothetical protein
MILFLIQVLPTAKTITSIMEVSAKQPVTTPTFHFSLFRQLPPELQSLVFKKALCHDAPIAVTAGTRL